MKSLHSALVSSGYVTNDYNLGGLKSHIYIMFRSEVVILEVRNHTGNFLG